MQPRLQPRLHLRLLPPLHHCLVYCFVVVHLFHCRHLLVANKLSTTVQVLHQAHLGEDQLSAASSRCLTCNRTVVSVAPRPAPVHKQQPAKLIPIGLRVHSRPRTASPASKRYGNNKNQQKIRVPYDTRDRNIQPSGSQDSLARQTSASSLNGETASYERMQPLFNYVKGCDGRLFRGSS